MSKLFNFFKNLVYNKNKDMNWNILNSIDQLLKIDEKSRNKIQIAAHNGNKNGKLLRDYISKRMPREESQKLKSIAISCINKNYKKC